MRSIFKFIKIFPLLVLFTLNIAHAEIPEDIVFNLPVSLSSDADVEQVLSSIAEQVIQENNARAEDGLPALKKQITFTHIEGLNANPYLELLISKLERRGFMVEKIVALTQTDLNGMESQTESFVTNTGLSSILFLNQDAQERRSALAKMKDALIKLKSTARGITFMDHIFKVDEHGKVITKKFLLGSNIPAEWKYPSDGSHLQWNSVRGVALRTAMIAGFMFTLSNMIGTVGLDDMSHFTDRFQEFLSSKEQLGQFFSNSRLYLPLAVVSGWVYTCIHFIREITSFKMQVRSVAVDEQGKPAMKSAMSYVFGTSIVQELVISTAVLSTIMQENFLKNDGIAASAENALLSAFSYSPVEYFRSKLQARSERAASQAVQENNPETRARLEAEAKKWDGRAKLTADVWWNLVYPVLRNSHFLAKAMGGDSAAWFQTPFIVAGVAGFFTHFWLERKATVASVKKVIGNIFQRKQTETCSWNLMKIE